MANVDRIEREREREREAGRVSESTFLPLFSLILMMLLAFFVLKMSIFWAFNLAVAHNSVAPSQQIFSVLLAA